MKKVFALLLISFMAVSCLFAENWYQFSLSLNIERLCYPAFWQAGTTSDIPSGEVNIMPLVGNSSFATMGLAYKGTLNISLDVGYCSFYRLDSVNNETTFDLNNVVNYTLDIRQPDSETAYVFGTGCGAISPVTSAHYGKQISFNMYRLLNNVNPTSLGTATVSNGISLIRICDFYVDELNMTNSSSGDYLSILVCQVTIE